MKIMALECGGAVAHLVALEIWGDSAQVSAVCPIDEPRALSRVLISRFDEVLTESGWKLDELDGLSIGTGPGSWTSLRIGISTFKTLSQTLNIPLAGIPTFDALASAVYRAKLDALPRRKKSKNTGFESQILLAVMACRPGEFYGKTFEMEADRLSPAQGEWIADAKMHLDAAYCQAMASEISPPLLLCGESAAQVGELLEIRGEPYEIAQPSPETVVIEIALAGASQMANGQMINPLDVMPLYLAPSHAERYLAAKSGGVLAS